MHKALQAAQKRLSNYACGHSAQSDSISEEEPPDEEDEEDSIIPRFPFFFLSLPTPFHGKWMLSSFCSCSAVKLLPRLPFFAMRCFFAHLCVGRNNAYRN